MASQSMKQQIHQSIVNSQVQQVMAQKREQEIAQLQASFDAWNKQQDEIANLQAQYDSWLAEQPQPQPVRQAAPEPVGYVRPTTGVPDKNGVVSKQQIDYANMPGNQFDKEKAAETIAKKEEERRIKKGDLTSDIVSQISGNVIPKLRDKNEPVERTQEWKDSVNNTLRALNSKEVKQANALADYNKFAVNKSNEEKWLSPDYKLTDEDKKAAKKYAQAELQKLDYDSNKKPILKSAEDRQHYADMVNLLNKSNTLTNAMTGVIKQPAALGRAVRDARRSLTNQITGLGAALGDKLGITKGATQRHNQNVADRDAFYRQNDESMQRALEGAHTQNPMATGAGEIGGQVAMYALTNPMFDALGAAAGLGKAGSFALNQVGQNAQDLALDTIPMLNNYLEGGVSDEERKELLKNVGINAAGNLAFGVAGEGISAFKKNRAARKAADEAFRANALEGADKLAKLAGTDTLEEAAEAAAKQIPNMENPLGDIAKGIEDDAFDVTKTGKKKTLANKMLNEYTADFAEDVGKAQQIDKASLKKSTNNMKTSFREKIRFLRDKENPYAKAFLNSVDEFADNPTAESYNKMISAHEDYMANYNKSAWQKGKYGSYHPEYHSEQIIKRLDDIGDEYGLKGNKVMAEDTGIPKGTPEPESVKTTIEIPDTPENAPIAPKPEVQPTDPNMKVSETYTNTGRRGGGWNAEEYSKYTDPQNYTYETIDELRSVEEATNMRATEGREAFKNRVLNQDKVSSIELDGLMMEWRELTQEARALEDAGKDASKLWEESNKIFRKVQTQSTANAQALQSLAKWSRNTPEGMLLNAENIVNGKTKANKTELQKFIDKHFKNKKGEIQFSPEFEKEFLNTAESLRGLSGTQLDSREAKEAMAKLGKMVNEQLPVKLNEKLQSFLMDNMLGNFRTLITRNAGGNLGLNFVEQTLERPLAAGIDSLVSLKTGKRTQAGLTKAGLAEYIQGFGKGLADEGKDFKSGLHTARSGENTLENAIRANRHVFKTKVADGLDGLVKHGLSVGDRPYYEAVYKQTLGDYQRLFNRGLLGEDIQKLSPEDFKAYSETAAKMNALGAVYQQDTMLSKALLDLKKGVGELSDGILGVDILSQFSMPFVKTPANVVERAIDYSPLGLVRNAFRTGKEMGAGAFDQNRFVNEASRNILGTALMGGGAAYAANGGMSGKYSENKNEKQAQKEAGMQEYAWNVPEAIPFLGGKQMDIGWLPVVGSNLVAAAAAIDAYKNGEGSFGENLTSGLEAGGKALFDQSMFQGLQRLFGTGEAYNSDEGIVGNMKNVVTSGVGQAIPSLLRQIAQVTDENQRDLAYSNEGTSFGPFDNYAINNLANNLPYVRENYLAPKVDTSGNLLQENQGRNVGMKILEDMILPGKLTNVNMSPLAQEASRLSGSTYNAFIPKADRSAIDTEEHTLSNEEWVLYQQNYYQEMTKAGTQLLDSAIYKNANEETQAKLLNETYGAIKSAINSEYTGKDVSGAAKAYKEAGGGDKGVKAVVDYETAHDIMKNANVSSSSKAAEAIQEAVSKGNMAEAERLAKVEEDYNKACEAAGVTEKSSGTRKAYDDGGLSGLKKYVEKPICMKNTTLKVIHLQMPYLKSTANKD